MSPASGRTPTNLQTAAVGALLAWDNHVNRDGDQREVVIAMQALRNALPKSLVDRTDRIIAERNAGAEDCQ